MCVVGFACYAVTFCFSGFVCVLMFLWVSCVLFALVFCFVGFGGVVCFVDFVCFCLF